VLDRPACFAIRLNEHGLADFGYHLDRRPHDLGTRLDSVKVLASHEQL